VAVAGGKDPSGVDAALDEARRLTSVPEGVPVRPGRAVGVDLGARRIGIAVSDSAGTLATPRGTIVRSGDRERDRMAVVTWCARRKLWSWWSATPCRSTAPGPGSHGRRGRGEALGALLAPHGVQVELFDERLTTVTAHQALSAGGTKDATSGPWSTRRRRPSC